MEAIYLSRDDAFDMESWSGTPYWMAKAFESAGFHLNYVCPLKSRFKLYYKVKGKLIRSLGWDYTMDGEWAFLRGYGKEATPLVQAKPGKVILSCGKPHVLFLETDRPIITFDDASTPAIITTHPGFKNLFPPNKRRLHEAERRAITKCRFACYSSSWAAEAALKAYGAEFESKIKVIPFGANADVKRSRQEVDQVISKRQHGECNLLLVGRSWEGKGGPLAVAVAEELHRRGVKVKLDIVGCRPPSTVSSFVRVHGFVSKKTKEGTALLNRLYEESHFFILPTQFEAYGIVFVEASSYGLPSVGTAIGGVTTIIKDGANGKLFPLEASASEYANYIEGLLQRPAAYEELCRTSFSEYEKRLNWGKFGETVRTLVESIENQTK